MESNQFWAFFVIALIAGFALAFTASSAMTGYITWPWQTAPQLAPAVNQVATTTTEVSATGCGDCICVPAATLMVIDSCLRSCGDCLKNSVCCSNCFRLNVAKDFIEEDLPRKLSANQFDGCINGCGDCLTNQACCSNCFRNLAAKEHIEIPFA